MRTVGPNTQAEIDAQVFKRSIRISVYDESGNEIPVPFDAIRKWPKVESDLDKVTWRMDAVFNRNPTTTGIFLRGRTIKAWDVFATGEDLPLFSGYIADALETDDYASGYAEDTYSVTCMGELARKWDTFFTRYEWRPATFNPGAGSPDESNHSPRLTGIVRKYRLTVTYTHDATQATTSAAAWNATGGSPPQTYAYTTLSAAPPFSVGDRVFVSSGHRVEKFDIAAVNAGNQLQMQVPDDTSHTVGFTNVTFYPSGSKVTKSGVAVPMAAPLYFGDTNLENWITVYKSDGVTVMTSGTDYNAFIDMVSGLLTLVFWNSPGSTFTIDVYAVERWCILNHRRYNGTVVAPYYYILSGIAGQTGAERWNDLAKTTVRADKTHTNAEVWAADPSGIFASDSLTTRWISVWLGGVEYFGKAASVDKSGGANNGQILLDASYPLRSYSGTLLTGLQGGEQLGNTSTTCYEILDPGCRYMVLFEPNGGNSAGSAFKGEHQGGWFILGAKTKKAAIVIPGYAQDLTTSAMNWQFSIDCYNNPSPFVAPAASGYNPSDANASNDVAQCMQSMLLTCGIPSGNFQVTPTGYTLAPFARAQTKAGDMLDQIRKDTIPPNYRVREDESGNVVMGYVAQLPTAQFTLRSVENFKPKENPKAVTRVIVRGKQTEVSRAGQLNPVYLNIQDTQKLFDGFNQNFQQAAVMTTSYASVTFTIPNIEPGRWPIVSKVVTSNSSTGQAFVGARKTTSDPIRWLPTGVKQNDGTQNFNKQEWTGFEAGGFSNLDLQPNIPWLLIAQFEAYGLPGQTDSTSYWIDEVEVWVKEGPYWEAALTSGTANAPADGPLGTAGFGASWNVPNRLLSQSYRFAPLTYMQRNAPVTHQVLVVDVPGATVGQCRDIAEAYINQAVRGAEFYTCQAAYDPRVQQGDTVAVNLDDGSTKTLLVWGLSKEEQTMQLTIADYSL
jgi:hypothetical protein